MKCLFLLKKNQSYGSNTSKSGLLNSATFVAEALRKFLKFETQVSICVDGNSIDREVHLFKPDVCFIEAIWVTPEKMKELTKLHPKVLFIIRVHSRTTFLANEGNATEWIRKYNDIEGVYVSFNNDRTNLEWSTLIQPFYLPNIYDYTRIIKNKSKNDTCNYHNKTINIGCFGAVRPMKNQLHQAIAAIGFGNRYDKKVRFHINSGRVEQQGDSALKNLRALFTNTRHELVEHAWLERPEFLDLIKLMDVGMQVSLSESFNIVTADFVSSYVPIVVSEEIEWMPDLTKVLYSDALEMSEKLKQALVKDEKFTKRSFEALDDYNTKAIMAWDKFFRNKIVKDFLHK
jgi:hypothetical protein